ncbi:MAG TPA: maltose alpha-D-glucosyltransferase [Silvibacterium sp.]|nr:maltose alpha-D-glucosyltransferase [Silvibacterium sp.]
MMQSRPATGLHNDRARYANSVPRGVIVRKPGSASDPLWYKDAVIYELHVKAFADGNNDGIGDFPGLLGKLDYLQDLGVTCIWLLPFFPSPLRDDGYDISDYVNVNPSYGTLADFQEFLDAAHKRGMQVLIELVINHTSDQHQWFQRARLAPPGSVERDFYVWSDSDAKFRGVRIIFSDTEKSNWTWDPVAKAYYWHRFFSHQPDLNFDNPLVLDETLSAMRFWLDMGVDGLRMDAIPYLVERDGTNCENLPETHAIIKQFRAAIDAEYANRFVLAEANQWPTDVRPYFGDGDECQMAFHFPLMPRIYVAIRQEDCLPITEIMAQTPDIPPNCQWGLFLRNHDELTLEMVTDDERDYMYLAYSANPRMRLNLGIRRRLAPLLDNNRLRIELLNSILFSFPGTPILYYGDEIGMGDNIELGDRNGVRTPMQWNGEKNAGFSQADPEELYSPVISDPVYGYLAVNVQEQLENPSSLLQWTRNMIGLRKLFPVFGRGSFRILTTTNRKVLAYLRQFGSQTVLCVANISRSAQPVLLDLNEFEGRTPVEMLGYVSFPKITAQPYFLTLSAYAFLWFELQVTGAGDEPTAHAPVVTAAADSADWDSPPVLVRGTQLVASAPAIDAQLAERGAGAITVLDNEQSTETDLLIVVEPANREELDKATAAIVGHFADSFRPARAVLAYPAKEGDPGAALGAQAIGGAPWLSLVPFLSDSGWHTSPWHTAQTFFEASRLASEQDARAVLLLSRDAASLGRNALGLLSRCVLNQSADLAVPRYLLSPYEGLLSTAILYPLTRALYGSDIRYPLAGDLVLSAGFAAEVAKRLDHPAAWREEEIVWPSTEAVLGGYSIAQAEVRRGNVTQPEGYDVTALLTRVVGALFADIESRALDWQQSRPVARILEISDPGVLDAAMPESHSPADARPMIESFRLAGSNLEDIWGQVMTPRTLLAVKRLAQAKGTEHAMPDALWVRIVYDFLAAYRARTVNRNHLLGALMPLYLGWAASHVLAVSTHGEKAAEQRINALAAAFEADKPYLVARWRWPDRFNP